MLLMSDVSTASEVVMYHSSSDTVANHHLLLVIYAGKLAAVFHTLLTLM